MTERKCTPEPVLSNTLKRQVAVQNNNDVLILGTAVGRSCIDTVETKGCMNFATSNGLQIIYMK